MTSALARCEALEKENKILRDLNEDITQNYERMEKMANTYKSLVADLRPGALRT